MINVLTRCLAVKLALDTACFVSSMAPAERPSPSGKPLNGLMAFSRIPSMTKLRMWGSLP